MGPKFPSSRSPPGAALRNIEVLVPALRSFLSPPTTKRVLELASGDGTHVLAYANAFPGVRFQPSECDAFGAAELDKALGGVAAIAQASILDVLDEAAWAQLEGPFDLVLAANCLHMMPFPEGPTAIFAHLASPALLAAPHGRFCVYGPFRSTAGYFSDADKAFEAMIRARPDGERFGLRSIEALEDIALRVGWVLVDKIEMPKGNFVLVWGPKQAC